MPWDLFGAGSGQNANQARALEQRFAKLERRLALQEQQPIRPANVTLDFTAREDETIFVEAPTAGLGGLLPAPTSRNRGAIIRLVFQNTNPVTLRAVSGTVNGQASLYRALAGAVSLVSDGATGWWLESLNLPRPRDAHLQDWFASGNTTSGSIGALGWNLAGTLATYARASVALNSSSKGTLTTGIVTNDRAVLTLGDTESRDVVDPQDFTFLQAAWNFNTVLTNKTAFFGLGANFATAPASMTDALGFFYDSSVGANYLLLARAGSAGSAVDSGVAAPSNTSELLTIWQQTPGFYRFYIGNRLIGTLTGNTLIPNVPLNCGFRVATLTVAAKSMRLGYFGLRAMSLTGALDDDEFLKS